MKKLLLFSILSLNVFLSLAVQQNRVNFSGRIHTKSIDTLSETEQEQMDGLRNKLITICQEAIVKMNTLLEENVSLLDLSDTEKPLLELNLSIVQGVEEQEQTNREE
jgi:hypothetical protein